MSEKTTLEYWFEWYSPVLWTERGAAVLPNALPLSPETVSELERLTRWHDTCMNWFDPSMPGPWKQEECDRFNAASDALYRRICSELGPSIEVVNRQHPYAEDPDLEDYLQNPDGYILSKKPWLKELIGRPSAKNNPFGSP
jgi:hypothetical protein